MPAEQAIEQAELDIKYQEELWQHLDRNDTLSEGLNKSYALISISYCTNTMQSRIEEHPKSNIIIKNDPISLLQSIKTRMKDLVWAQYPLLSITNTLDRVFNVKQTENDNLLDYVKRFKQLSDVAKNQLGR